VVTIIIKNRSKGFLPETFICCSNYEREPHPSDAHTTKKCSRPNQVGQVNKKNTE